MRILLLLGLLLSETGWSACSGLAMSNLANPSFSFNTNSAPTLALTATKSNGSCSYFYTVDYGSSSSAATRKMIQGSFNVPMNVYSDSNHTKMVLQIPDVGGNNDVIPGNLGGGSSSQTISYYPLLGTAATYTKFGGYSDTFTIRLYEGSTNSPTFRDSKTVTFTYTMAKVIDLSLVDSGSAFNVSDTTQTMAFGTLVAGAQKSFDVIVKFNAGYNVKLSSANQGNLKHTTLSDLVPYTFTLNSSTINLTGSNTTPVSATSGTGVSAANGLILPSTVTIGALGSARAGNYSDLVTITVATTE